MSGVGGKLSTALVSDRSLRGGALGQERTEDNPVWLFSHVGYSVFVWNHDGVLQTVPKADGDDALSDMWIVWGDEDPYS